MIQLLFLYLVIYWLEFINLFINPLQIALLLEVSSQILVKRFNTNYQRKYWYIKGNTDKSPLLMSGNKEVIANIGINCINSEDLQELLGITIDSNLTFETILINFAKKKVKNQTLLLEFLIILSLIKKDNNGGFHYITI